MRTEDHRISRDPRSSILDPQIPRQAENSEVAFDPHLFNVVSETGRGDDGVGRIPSLGGGGEKWR
jgi:hypothetical protein